MTKSELQIFAEQTFPLSFAHNPKVDVEELINQVAAAAIAHGTHGSNPIHSKFRP
jgi:hypothetical protein